MVFEWFCWKFSLEAVSLKALLSFQHVHFLRLLLLQYLRCVPSPGRRETKCIAGAVKITVMRT